MCECACCYIVVDRFVFDRCTHNNSFPNIYHASKISLSLSLCAKTVKTDLYFSTCILFIRIQVEDARNKGSELSTKMYNSVLDSHEKSKDLDKTLKDLTKELQALNKEKEAIEKRRTEAIKKHTELELDVKDLQEKISGNIRAKVIVYLCLQH